MECQNKTMKRFETSRWEKARSSSQHLARIETTEPYRNRQHMPPPHCPGYYSLQTRCRRCHASRLHAKAAAQVQNTPIPPTPPSLFVECLIADTLEYLTLSP